MSAKDKKILIVEDEEDIRELYADYLEDFTISQCESAKETLAKLEDYKPDLLIVDLGLPDMDGMEFIAKVRSDYSEKVFIVIISGILDIEYCMKANEQDVTDLITKPFEKEQLIELVKRKLNI